MGTEEETEAIKELGEYVPDDFIPQLGQAIEGHGVVMICEAVNRRQQKFPDESLTMSFSLILLNIQARYTPLRCEGKEWKGYKKDLVLTPGENPTCPNGHALIKERGVTLGWVIDNS